MSAIIANEPLYCVARGGGKLLELLKRGHFNSSIGAGE